MLNMLRMDLRRMFRSRMFYIAFLCLTAGILIMIIMLHTITDPELREQAIDAHVGGLRCLDSRIHVGFPGNMQDLRYVLCAG